MSISFIPPVSGGGTPYDPLSGRAIFATGQWGYWSVYTSASIVAGTGLFNDIQETDSSSTRNGDAFGLAFRQTQATINLDASLRTLSDSVRPQYLPFFITKWRINQTTDMRLFSGLINSSSIPPDDIANEGMGIQYSTNRSDTNFQLVMRDATTQTLIDTGIAVDTNVHFTKIDVESSTSMIVALYDSNFVEQATNTFTTNLPADSTQMRMLTGIETLVASAKTVDQFFGSILFKV